MSEPAQPHTFTSVGDFLRDGLRIHNSIPTSTDDTKCPICQEPYTPEEVARTVGPATTTEADSISTSSVPTAIPSASPAVTSTPIIIRSTAADARPTIIFSTAAPSSPTASPTEAEDNNNRIVQITACDHHFHYSCLHTWVTQSRSNNNTCPICRSVLFLNGPGAVIDGRSYRVVPQGFESMTGPPDPDSRDYYTFEEIDDMVFAVYAKRMCLRAGDMVLWPLVPSIPRNRELEESNTSVEEDSRDDTDDWGWF